MCVLLCILQIYTLWLYHRTITSYQWERHMDLVIYAQLLWDQPWAGIIQAFTISKSSKTTNLRKAFFLPESCVLHTINSCSWTFHPYVACVIRMLWQRFQHKTRCLAWRPGIDKTSTYLLFFSELICFQGFGLQILLYNKHKEKTSWPRELSFPGKQIHVAYHIGSDFVLIRTY